ncbi:MAG: SDR family oxidoreductase [Candidatus Roizmanbacteria bacterium]|nr:SDR family oxidoreductase [Candidatus Roizmanbacteria bacterium]
MQTVLIAGGAGFIGSNLTKTLLDQGDTVWIIDNLITGRKKNIEQYLNHDRLHFIEGDITNPTALEPLQTVPFTIIFHLASPASPIQYANHPEETLLASSTGTRHLLQLARKTKARLVYASTSEVYGDPLEHPQKETYWGNVNSFGPRSCYDEAKRFGEALCYTYIHRDAVNVKIARIFNTYGPNMEQNDGRVVSNFITQALTGKPITIYGDGKQTRSFCFVDDMVAGLMALSQTKEIETTIFNLGNPHERTMLDIAQQVLALTGSQSTIVHKDKPVDDPSRRKPDITRAKTILKWEPNVHLEDGLKKTIAYFKKEVNL